MSRIFGLPPLPTELKPISPYLQRADELKTKEPVMAYWCAYYAAQLGISLRAKDVSSRTVLSALLTELETLKRTIGPNDAVDAESASAAYVENFALRVFAMADNEDRRGDAGRGTAKKFLAAANFLEVLKVFPKNEVSESNEEKIRYAKWKAADIARAFREGRTPTPGPAAQQSPPPQSSSPPPTTTSPPPSSYAFEPVPGAPKTAPRMPSPPSSQSSSSATKRTSPPPPHMYPSDIARANGLQFPQTPPRLGGEGDEGTWSTLATPGSAGGVGPSSGTRTGFAYGHDETPVKGRGRSRSRLRSAWVSEELEGREGNGNIETGEPQGARKAVHFSPSVTGGLSSTDGSPPVSPAAEDKLFGGPAHTTAAGTDPTMAPLPESSGSEGSGSPRRAVSPPSLHAAAPAPITPNPNISPVAPPIIFPSSPPYHQPTVQPSANIPPPAAVPPPPIIPTAPFLPMSSNTHPVPQQLHPPHPQYLQQPHPQPSQYGQPAAPPPPPELTPSLIAKAQKHCRFAISALDYEDADQARRELRAALTVLGG